MGYLEHFYSELNKIANLPGTYSAQDNIANANTPTSSAGIMPKKLKNLMTQSPVNPVMVSGNSGTMTADAQIG